MQVRNLLLYLTLLFCSYQLKAEGPYISGEIFKTFCDFIFDETQTDFNPKKVKKGDVIFVKTDMLEEFFASKHPKIQASYIIVSHNSDHGISSRFQVYLEDPKIIAWFAQNVEVTGYDKLHPIPIGIANSCWPHGNWQVMDYIRSKHLNSHRDLMLYMNFALGTNPNERVPVYNSFINQPYCFYRDFSSIPTYLEDVSHAKFVLSPRGNGLDCHRTWEALIMGAIPIVKTSPMDSLYEGLPVIIVKDWSEVTQHFLEKKWQEMASHPYTNEKLFPNYWRSRILKAKLIEKFNL